MSKKICNNCGSDLEPTDVFCPYCGTPITIKDDTIKGSDSAMASDYSEEHGAQCPNCNRINNPKNQFCKFCGTTLSQATSGQSSFGQQESYNYGSFSETSSTGERKWYSPPERQRSAKHPIEWFFWTGWGLYILIRFIFTALFCFLQIYAQSKRR
jgi:RNA polymerase subunit RPABC4/transcription elongation factor Spt4